MQACRLLDIFRQLIEGLTICEDADAYSPSAPGFSIKVYFEFHQHLITISHSTVLPLLDISRFPKENALSFDSRPIRRADNDHIQHASSSSSIPMTTHAHRAALAACFRARIPPHVRARGPAWRRPHAPGRPGPRAAIKRLRNRADHFRVAYIQISKNNFNDTPAQLHHGPSSG